MLLMSMIKLLPSTVITMHFYFITNICTHITVYILYVMHSNCFTLLLLYLNYYLKNQYVYSVHIYLGIGPNVL